MSPRIPDIRVADLVDQVTYAPSHIHRRNLHFHGFRAKTRTLTKGVENKDYGLILGPIFAKLRSASFSFPKIPETNKRVTKIRGRVFFEKKEPLLGMHGLSSEWVFTKNLQNLKFLVKSMVPHQCIHRFRLNDIRTPIQTRLNDIRTPMTTWCV